jgi:hypothetical protein
MKTLRASLSIVALGLIPLMPVAAQKAVAPPPKPADGGPSLEAAMKVQLALYPEFVAVRA